METEKYQDFFVHHVDNTPIRSNIGQVIRRIHLSFTEIISTCSDQQ